MKLLMLSAAIGFCFSSCGQDIPASKVPSVVQNSLKAKFPSTDRLEWEIKRGIYEADFDMDSTEYTVHIDASGTILQYKMDIEETALPAAIIQAISAGHTGWIIDEVEKLIKGNNTYYVVELESKGSKDKEVIYSPDGIIAKDIDHSIKK